MTLLIYAATAHPDQADGSLLADICRQIDARYPLAFSVIAVRDPPANVQPSDRRDWITLPQATLPPAPCVWNEPDVAAVEVLTACAGYYRPCATIFVGSGAQTIREALQTRSGRLQLGEQIFVAQRMNADLFSTLDRILPASLLVSKETEPSTFRDLLAGHDRHVGISLCWEGAPAAGCLQLLQIAREATSGKVTLQLGLRELVRTSVRSLLLLGQLLRLRDRRVAVAIVAEDGAAMTAGRAMTRIMRSIRRSTT